MTCRVQEGAPAIESYKRRACNRWRLLCPQYLLLLAVLSGFALPAYGQRYGLLLGLGYSSNGSLPTARGAASGPASGPLRGFGTVWLTIDGSNVHATVLRDIIVPRSHGFWRLKIERAEVRTEETLASETFLWSGPVNAKYRPPSLQDADCPQFSYAQLPTWVNPDYVSVDAFQSATCAHYDENSDAYVWALNELTMPRSVDNLAPRLGMVATLGHVALQDAERQADKLSAPKTEDPFADCGKWFASDGSWYVAHRQGAWHAVALLGRVFCDRLSERAEVTSPQLDRLANQKPPPISFSMIKRLIPSAVDVVFSTGNDIAVIITERFTLDVYAVKANTLSPQLSSLDLSSYGLGTSIVLTEWSLGTHIADWERQMQLLPKLDSYPQGESSQREQP